MATPGTALIGYAVLRANYNAQAPNYLDNFAPFVLSAVANSGRNTAERSEIPGLISSMFGINIPALVLPRLLRRTNREELTLSAGNLISLTEKALSELPDLQADVVRYQKRQAELAQSLAAFIEDYYPEHLELKTRDMAGHLAAFFDRHAVPLLGASLRGGERATPGETGLDYVVAAFVEHAYTYDQARFEYITEAAKGAMLASVLELDTTSLNESLNRLTLVLDTPVMMDALGYHGATHESAMGQVILMAKNQGARVGIFRHSIDELDGILDSVENALKRGASSKSTSRGYLHFVEKGASPADLALAREALETTIEQLGAQILDRPSYDRYGLGLDEVALESAIQERVKYAQDASRVNDVLSLSAVHRMRSGNDSPAIEKCTAVFISSNENLVRGVRDFNRRTTAFPIAITTEAIASILWVRSPALAADAPRELVLASAYAGMQPSPLLWSRYIEEVEKLETAGSVSPQEAFVLRSTSVGRDALMAETLGDAETIEPDSPLVVLDRVRNGITDPIRKENSGLASALTETEAELASTRLLADSLQREIEKERLRETAEKEQRIVAERAAQDAEDRNEALANDLARLKESERARASRISEQARESGRRVVKWISRASSSALTLGAFAFYYATRQPEWPIVVVAGAILIGCGSFLLPVFGPLRQWFDKMGDRYGARKAKKALRVAGFEPDDLLG